MGNHRRQCHRLDRLGRNHRPMTPPYDEQQLRAAAQTERAHPGWAVIWGTHTRMYWAFPTFHAPPGTMIAAPDTAGLAPACSTPNPSPAPTCHHEPANPEGTTVPETTPGDDAADLTALLCDFGGLWTITRTPNG